MAEFDTKSVQLSANQRKALEALLRCPSVAQAARTCGLSERTLWRYLSDDVFVSELRTRQDRALLAVTVSLSGMSSTAVEALADLLDDDETPASVKARVALGWLAERRRTVELGDLVQRVTDLESSLGRDRIK